MNTWSRRGIFLVSLAAMGGVPAAGAEKLVILLLGAPGSGKTTQAGNLSGKYDVPAYSMSDILKKEAGWVNTPLKKSMKIQLASGDFVSDEVANQLIEKYVSQKKAENGFILDGYPATAKQAEYLDQTLTRLGLPAPIVVHLLVPDNVARERMTARGRADDKPEIIEQRLAAYHSEAGVVLKRYHNQVKPVDGTKSEGEVWRSIQAAMAE